jgi:hypothetical protein
MKTNRLRKNIYLIYGYLCLSPVLLLFFLLYFNFFFLFCCAIMWCFFFFFVSYLCVVTVHIVYVRIGESTICSNQIICSISKNKNQDEVNIITNLKIKQCAASFFNICVLAVFYRYIFKYIYSSSFIQLIYENHQLSTHVLYVSRKMIILKVSGKHNVIC